MRYFLSFLSLCLVAATLSGCAGSEWARMSGSYDYDRDYLLHGKYTGPGSREYQSYSAANRILTDIERGRY